MLEYVKNINKNPNTTCFSYDREVCEDSESTDFCKIMEICFPYCSYFSLTQQTTFSYKSKEYETFRKALSPHLKLSFLTAEWFCYYTTYEINPLSVSIYYLNETSKQLLLDTYKDVFMNDIFSTKVNMPEDICFLREDKSLFFGSVSHENIAEFYLTNEELKTCQIPNIFEKRN